MFHLIIIYDILTNYSCSKHDRNSQACDKMLCCVVFFKDCVAFLMLRTVKFVMMLREIVRSLKKIRVLQAIPLRTPINVRILFYLFNTQKFKHTLNKSYKMKALSCSFLSFELFFYMYQTIYVFFLGICQATYLSSLIGINFQRLLSKCVQKRFSLYIAQDNNTCTNLRDL